MANKERIADNNKELQECILLAENLPDADAGGGGYEQGYAAGYETGSAEGYSKGHTEGYTKGHTEGVEQGYAEGYEASNVTIKELVGKSITSFSSNDITNVGAYAFAYCTKMTSIDLPNVTSIGLYGFSNAGITSADFPKLQSINTNGFYSCTKLKTVRLPSLKTGAAGAFISCSAVERIDLLSLGTVAANTFSGCFVLTALILRSQTLIPLVAASAFTNCLHIHGTKNSTYNPQGLKDGYIYVPKELIEDYKAATNWSSLATQFRALEDYTVDGTITGELDEGKI